MGIKGFDQWIEQDPAMDEDIVADAEKLVEQVQWAKMNWDTELPDVWKPHVDNLLATVEKLVEFIEEIM